MRLMVPDGCCKCRVSKEVFFVKQACAVIVDLNRRDRFNC